MSVSEVCNKFVSVQGEGEKEYEVQERGTSHRCAQTGPVSLWLHHTCTYLCVHVHEIFVDQMTDHSLNLWRPVVLVCHDVFFSEFETVARY